MGALGAAEDTDRDDWTDLELSYHTVRPNKWTFQSAKIRRWVESRLQGRVLNACAGRTKLANDHEIVRNDLDESRDADIHVDVCEIADHFEAESFHTIVYDPPFSQNQANETYDLEDGEAVVAGSDAVAKRQFDELLAPGGRVIQFGYTTTCMPTSLDYERLEVGVWNTLGRSNDYLSVVDKKPGETEVHSRWFSTESSVNETTGTSHEEGSQ
ncbi:SAM-dependent methyltransferase [Halosimplex sp. J119]